MHQNSSPNFSEPQAQRPFHRLKEPANLLCTGPSGKYSWLWGPQSLCHNDSTLCKSGHGPFINNRARQRADKTLFTPAGHDNSQQDAAGPHQHLPESCFVSLQVGWFPEAGFGEAAECPWAKALQGHCGRGAWPWLWTYRGMWSGDLLPSASTVFPSPTGREGVPRAPVPQRRHHGPCRVRRRLADPPEHRTPRAALGRVPL